jgi:hypothetical protein
MFQERPGSVGVPVECRGGYGTHTVRTVAVPKIAEDVDICSRSNQAFDRLSVASLGGEKQRAVLRGNADTQHRNKQGEYASSAKSE